MMRGWGQVRVVLGLECMREEQGCPHRIHRSLNHTSLIHHHGENNTANILPSCAPFYGNEAQPAVLFARRFSHASLPQTSPLSFSHRSQSPRFALYHPLPRLPSTCARPKCPTPEPLPVTTLSFQAIASVTESRYSTRELSSDRLPTRIPR